MNSQITPALRRISGVVRALACLGALMLLALPPWLITSGRWTAFANSHMASCAKQTGTTVGAWTPWLAGLVIALPIAVGLFTLWQLWRLFGEYLRGAVFGRPAQRHLRLFAVGVLCGAVLAPLVRTAMTLVMTMYNPPGQRVLAIGVGSDDYVAILFGAVLLAIASVMAEAVRVAEDHAGFV